MTPVRQTSLFVDVAFLILFTGCMAVKWVVREIRDGFVMLLAMLWEQLKLAGESFLLAGFLIIKQIDPDGIYFPWVRD